MWGGRCRQDHLREAPGIVRHVRLSIDEEIWSRFGRFGIDYPAGEYPSLGETAQRVLRERLLELLDQDRDVVLDFSFWRRADRERYKRLIEGAGGRWRLIYLRADPSLLRRRLEARAARFDANAAFPMTDAVLDAYLAGFEAPDGEGEEVINAT